MDTTKNTKSRVRGGFYAASKHLQARLIHNKGSSMDGMDLEDPEFNKSYRTKGADLPYREKVKRTRPMREGMQNE